MYVVVLVSCKTLHFTTVVGRISHTIYSDRLKSFPTIIINYKNITNITDVLEIMLHNIALFINHQITYLFLHLIMAHARYIKRTK